MTLLVQADLGESIEAIVNGDVSVESAPYDVLVACARRYIDGVVRQRQRADMRSREAEAKFEQAKESAKARLRAKANLITTELAQSLHREWTAALLAGEFALPDGSRVTWADATAAQHALRADQLEGLAAGDLATAAIHRQAINDLRTAGVNSLGELP